MPNSQNFPDGISTNVQGRPTRTIERDTKLFFLDNKQVIFGDTLKDIVEVYVYDTDDNIIAHLNYDANSPALSLTKLVSVDNTQSYLDVNLPTLVTELGITPGRYTMVMNFFKNEVGSEEGEKLYIDEISRSRTEVRLRPFSESLAVRREMDEFLMPSVPKLYAQALINEIFGQSLDAGAAEQITANMIFEKLDLIAPSSEPISTRIQRSGLSIKFISMIANLVHQANKFAIDYLAGPESDDKIQRIQLLNIFRYAIGLAIANAQTAGAIDVRFQVVT